MLYIFRAGRHTGTTYDTDNHAARAHHTSQGEVCVWIADDPDLAVGDTIDNLDELIEADAAMTVRAERDALLTACDWTLLRDAPLSTEQVAEWAAYRQELRDVPQQAGFPQAVTWPEAP
ncbi:MAG: tail fiber assembly protein [Pseudodesulfovibrio sp.]|uniref:tail fiber assembly protein n=1 Tax=Pseudodesulfovibrio sp. TaxID=2035812 RepID=UPI003D142E9E